MDIVEREDALLSLMRFSERHSRGPSCDELVELTGLPVHTIQHILNALQESGDAASSEDHLYNLTPQGLAAAQAVMRRHHVLETFLQEMLGMDHEDAHAQACSMEHHTSEDTINRLRTFLHGRRRCRGAHDGHIHQGRTLADCSNGDQVIIEGIRGCGRALRLADLGLVPGERVQVRQKMAATLLIRVKGCDIAISPEIARSVLVEVDQ